MEHSPYIQTVRGIFGRKHVVAGTRLTVKFLQGLLDRG